ncbi:methyltransferase domain-containing protein [Paenibacillus turicensis]|uniref:class I SAM-dependent DNA methyltransferase n=1 Tax=Paenibacillus turicensis TaxID=160487 RepID=UPI003D2B56FB
MSRSTNNIDSSNKQSKERNLAHFDKQASRWHQQIPKETYNCIDKLIHQFNINQQHSILDIAAGTGVWLQRLHELEIYPNKYVALDISNQMLNQLKTIFPDIETHCLDIEEEISLDEKFEWVNVFNGTPHIKNMDMLFQNATKHLNKGGKLLIAHARTRDGLNEHHKSIGFIPPFEPIPSEEHLRMLSAKYGLINVIIKDEPFFYYCAEKA